MVWERVRGFPKLTPETEKEGKSQAGLKLAGIDQRLCVVKIGRAYHFHVDATADAFECGILFVSGVAMRDETGRPICKRCRVQGSMRGESRQDGVR